MDTCPGIWEIQDQKRRGRIGCRKSGVAQSKGGVCGGGIGIWRVIGKDPENS